MIDLDAPVSHFLARVRANKISLKGLPQMIQYTAPGRYRVRPAYADEIAGDIGAGTISIGGVCYVQEVVENTYTRCLERV